MYPLLQNKLPLHLNDITLYKNKNVATLQCTSVFKVICHILCMVIWNGCGPL